MKKTIAKLACSFLAVATLGGSAAAEEYVKFVECDNGDTWVDRWYPGNEGPIGFQLVIANPDITDYLERDALMYLNHKREAIVKTQNYELEDAFTAIAKYDTYQTPRHNPQVHEFVVGLSKSDSRVTVKFDIYNGQSLGAGLLGKGHRIGGWHFNNCRRVQ